MGSSPFSGTKTQAELRLRLFSITPSGASTVRELSENFWDPMPACGGGAMRRAAGLPQDDENVIVEAWGADRQILASGDRGVADVALVDLAVAVVLEWPYLVFP